MATPKVNWKSCSRIKITQPLGETAFFYCREPRPLLAQLAGADGLRYVHRASNLEDVFIKLTGRELRD